jgi:acetyl esterase/lipase
LFLLNIRGIRQALFGCLPFSLEKRPWGKVLTEEYLPGKNLDIYYPTNGKNRGTILFAHGGGWISGYKRQPNNLSWYRFIVSRGFTVSAIGYSRGYTAGIEQLIQEFSAALSFLSQNKGRLKLKEEKISVMGLSAGGHLALLSGMRNRSLVKNITAYYTPCDLFDIWDATSLFARFSTASVLKRLPYRRRSRAIYKQYSPIQHVSQKTPPVLLVHGARDSIVPYKSSLKMYTMLKLHDCSASLLLHSTGEHGFEFVLKDQRTKTIIEKTSSFWETK